MSDSQEHQTPRGDGNVDLQWQELFDELEEEAQSSELGPSGSTGIPILPLSRLTPIPPSSPRPPQHNLPFMVGNPWSNRWSNTDLPRFPRVEWHTRSDANHTARQQPARRLPRPNPRTVSMPGCNPPVGAQPHARAHMQSAAERQEGVERPLTAQLAREAEAASVAPPPLTEFEATFQALLINLRALEDIIRKTLELLGGLAETIQAEIVAKTDELRQEHDLGDE